MSNLVYNEAPRYSALGFQNSANTAGTPFTTSATLNAMGAYVQITAATPGTFEGFWIRTKHTTVANFLIDIAIGATGSEQVIVPQFWLPRLANRCEYIPLTVPAGSRMAVRGQNDTSASATADVMIIGKSWVGRTNPGGYRCIGCSDATASAGVQYDPGATINTLGPWTQMIASVTFPIRAISVYTQSTSNIVASVNWLGDIGYGSAGSEKLIFSKFLSGSPLNTCNDGGGMVIDTEVPAGQRLAYRAQSTDSATPNRLVRVQYLCYG